MSALLWYAAFYGILALIVLLVAKAVHNVLDVTHLTGRFGR